MEKPKFGKISGRKPDVLTGLAALALWIVEVTKLTLDDSTLAHSKNKPFRKARNTRENSFEDVFEKAAAPRLGCGLRSLRRHSSIFLLLSLFDSHLPPHPLEKPARSRTN
jgi:hypothetical protein